MDVLARLAVDYEANVAFVTELGPVYAILFWRDGCIKVELDAPGRLIQYGGTFEWTEEAFDADDANALIGWPFSSQVALPFDSDSKIIEAGPLYRGVRLWLETRRLLVNCSTRKIWER